MKYLFTILIFSFIGISAFGQYTGGKGSGYALASLKGAVSVNKNLTKKVTVSPNPVSRSGHATICSQTNWALGSIAIYSTLGALVFAKKSVTTKEIRIPKLAKGIYIITIGSPEGVITKKLSVIK